MLLIRFIFFDKYTFYYRQMARRGSPLIPKERNPFLSNYDALIEINLVLLMG